MIDRLDNTTVEEWKHHPATLAFVEYLKSLSNQQVVALVQKGNAGGESQFLYSMAGRCAQLGELIGFIQHAKGREHE